MKPNDEYSELNYYIVYLQAHLSAHYFPQSVDRRFIAERADNALDTYVTLFLQGKPQHIAQELAMRELLKACMYRATTWCIQSSRKIAGSVSRPMKWR